MRHFRALLFMGAAAAISGVAQDTKPSAIQDNSFLIEEAYNQEPGVVQHINTFTRTWNSKDWAYSFTQEWPWLDWHHQLSYTLTAAYASDFPGSRGGWGDLILNYRYQLIGNGESRVAFSPRVSLLVPTGDVTHGRGSGGVGVQANLPWSVELHPRLVAHFNAGATIIPHAQNELHDRAASAGVNLGQSFIYLLNSRVNLMLETTVNRYQVVTGPGKTEWEQTNLISPGVRWAHNYANGLQIVPGIAMPIGFGSNAGERGLFLYLSFEHPFTKN